MATEKVLLFQDQSAFVSYIKTVASDRSSLFGEDFELLYLSDSSKQSDTVKLGLLGRAVLNDLKPPESIAELVKAKIDRKSKSFQVSKRSASQGQFQIALSNSGARLPLLVKLDRIVRPPHYETIVYLTSNREEYQQLLFDHFTLGLDNIKVAAFNTKIGTYYVLWTFEPSFHLLQKWGEVSDSPTIQIFYESTKRNVFLEWGFIHPLEQWITDDILVKSMLLVDQNGHRISLKVDRFEDVGQSLKLEESDSQIQYWDQSERSPEIKLKLRLAERASPTNPEIWIVGTDRLPELEYLLESTPEDELKNLLLAIVTLPDGEEVFVIREVLSGRVPHLLPESGRVFAPFSRNVPNLMLPCSGVLEPPLRGQRYADAFKVLPGEITLLTAGEETSNIVSVKFPERYFRPMSQLVEFIFSGESERISECVGAIPFDFGEFAELDLIAPGQTAPAKKRDAEPQPQAETDDTEQVADHGMFERVKNLITGKKSQVKTKTVATVTETKRVVDENRLKLEGTLSKREGQAQNWFELSEYFASDGDYPEMLRAVENGLWIADQAEEQRGRELVIRYFKDGENLTALESLYGNVFHLTEHAEAEDSQEFGAQDIGKLTGQYWRELKGFQKLRKKSKWLLWRELLRLNGDDIEESEQREDILSDLALKGVEDREIPAFVRRNLLEFTRHKGTTGGGGKAFNFIEQAAKIITDIDNKTILGLAFATFGQAYVELGDSEQGLKLAAQAHANLPESMTKPLEAVGFTQIAALRELAGAGDQQKEFRGALRFLSQDKEFKFRKGLERWFKAIALSKMNATAAVELVNEGLEQIKTYKPPQRALLLKDISGWLTRIGETERASAMARELLSLPKTEFSSSDLTGQDTRGKEIIFYEELVATLDDLRTEETVSAEDGRLILKILDELSPQINEFTIDMALVAFRAPGIEAVTVGDEMAASLAKAGHDYAALNVRLAVLRYLAETKNRQVGIARISGFIDAVNRHSCKHKDCHSTKDFHRLRLFHRLVELIPALGASQETERQIEKISRLADSMNEYVKPNLLSVCAINQVKLGQRQDLMTMLENYTANASRLIREGQQSGAGTSDLFFWVLESVAEGIAAVGDAKRGLALTRQIAEITEGAMSDNWVPTQFWLYRALIRTGVTAMELGAAEYSEELLSRAFELILQRVTFGFDRTDLLGELIGAVKNLTSERRFELTADILREMIKTCREVGELGQDMLLSLLNTVAEDVVRGESAYAMELKRWKGEEERLIRDRVIGESLVEFE